jgi:hypothetical protein
VNWRTFFVADSIGLLIVLAFGVMIYFVLRPHGKSHAVMYQLGWATLPGLRGLSVSEFRVTPTNAPDNDRGVAMNFADEAERDAFLREIEAEFASRRFTNSADAFDTVKAYVVERAARR